MGLRPGHGSAGPHPLPEWNRYQWFWRTTQTVLGFASILAFIIPLTIADETVKREYAGVGHAFIMSLSNLTNVVLYMLKRELERRRIAINRGHCRTVSALGHGLELGRAADAPAGNALSGPDTVDAGDLPIAMLDDGVRRVEVLRSGGRASIRERAADVRSKAQGLWRNEAQGY